MTATALISGKLFRAPERKTSKSGKAYVSATVREGDGDAVIWWKVLCFSESGGEELVRLGDGESVAVSGAFKVDLYENKEGQTRLSYTVFADAVITARRQKKRTESKPTPSATYADRRSDSTSRAPESAPFDDKLPF